MFNNIEGIKFFCNSKKFSTHIDIPFSNASLAFLNELSNTLLKDKDAIKYGDILSLAFWLREKNIKEIRKNFFNKKHNKIGIGNIFHITPTNVPTNFVYSFIFGFLTGNSNLIKLPNQKFEQVDIICKHIKNLFDKKKYLKYKNSNFFFKYNSSNDRITKKISKISDVRMVWGGDETIKKIKKIDTKIKVKDLYFSEKYSLSIISSLKYLNSKNSSKIELAKNFYNDTFIFDQNACTSPRIILWEGKTEINKKAKAVFWKLLTEIVSKKYNIDYTNSVEKYKNFCLDSTENNKFSNFKNFSNLIYVVELKKITPDTYKIFKKFGYFYEYNLHNFESIKEILSVKTQTLSYFGYTTKFLENFIVKNKINTIDRITKIGDTMKMNFIWDGYNIYNDLTKDIEII